MRIALVNIVTDRQIDFANLEELKMWIQIHKAFLSKKQVERFALHRAESAPYRNYLRGGRYYSNYFRGSRYCTLKQFIYKHKLL